MVIKFLYCYLTKKKTLYLFEFSKLDQIETGTSSLSKISSSSILFTMQPSNSSPNESVSQISSNESVKKLASSKIPKLNKLHVFKKSLNRNFNSMKKLSKIPIRLIINKPIEQQQKQIRVGPVARCE